MLTSTNCPFYTESDYWNHKGLYQSDLERLGNEYVPIENDADTLIGQQLVAINRIGHEWFNNGNCNTSNCVTSWGKTPYDDDEEELVVDEFYEQLVYDLNRFICPYLNKEDKHNFIQALTCIECNFVIYHELSDEMKDKQDMAINYMIDKVLWVILSGQLPHREMKKRY